jgi:hypothetical protein
MMDWSFPRRDPKQSWADLCEEEEVEKNKPRLSRRQIVKQALEKKKRRWAPVWMAVRLLRWLARARKRLGVRQLRNCWHRGVVQYQLRRWLSSFRRKTYHRHMHCLVAWFWFDGHAMQHVQRMIGPAIREHYRRTNMPAMVTEALSDLESAIHVPTMFQAKKPDDDFQGQIIAGLKTLQHKLYELRRLEVVLKRHVRLFLVHQKMSWIATMADLRVSRWKTMATATLQQRVKAPDLLMVNTIRDTYLPDDPRHPLCQQWSKDTGLSPIWGFPPSTILRGRTLQPELWHDAC